MKFNLKETFKNAKDIDFLYDLKNYKKLKTSIIVPYACMLAPIFVIWISYFIWWAFGINHTFIGHLNTFPLWIFAVVPVLFCVIDIRRIVESIIDNKTKFQPIKWLKSSAKTYPEVLFLFLMFVWILVSTIANPSPSSVFSFRYTGQRMQEGVIFYLGYIIVFIFSFLLQDKNTHHRLLIAFLISSLFAGITTIIDPCGNFLLANQNNTVWAFAMINSNHYGYFLTLAVICSACMFLTAKSRGMKIFTAIAFLVNTVVIIFNDTLGCLLAVLAVLVLIPVFYSIRAKKFQWIYTLPLGIFVVLTFVLAPIAPHVGPSAYKSLAGQIAGFIKDFFSVTSAPLSEEASHAGTDRWRLWLYAFEGIAEHPWIGTGNVYFKPHNEYLQHAYNFGIPCLIFYLIALVIILVKALKNLRFLSDITLTLSVSTLAYLIQAMFGNTMPHIMPIFLVFFALSIRSINTDIQKRRQVNSTPQTSQIPKSENI